MRELWSRIERWFEDHLPDRTLRLRPGASEVAIARAEAVLDQRFPDDFRESLAVHDGQEDDPQIQWLPAAQRLGSLDAIVRCWRADRSAYDPDPQRLEWLDRGGAARQALFHPKQIPIAGSTYWDYDRLLLDFIPGPNGHPGQVVARCDIEIEHVCQSFRSLLEQTIGGLESGTITFQPMNEELASVPGELEVVYRSPRAKRPLAFFKYFR